MSFAQRNNPIQTLPLRVPISLSQREFACGLRLGAVITLRPSRVGEASNSAEKIASWVVDDEAILVVERNGFA